MTKRILLVTPFYEPDLGPSAPLYTMLCENLVQLGYNVCVIAAVPHYPTGYVTSEWRTKLVYKELRNGVNLIRVWVPSINRANLFQRQISYLIFQLLGSVVGFNITFDIIVLTNPAIEVGLAQLLLGVFSRKPILYIVQDIYPDVGISLGIFRSPVVIGILKSLEAFCFHTSARVQVISEGFKSKLVERGIPSAKMVVIPNWVDTEFIRPLPRMNQFSKKYGLEDRFIILYAGNLGLSQGLEDVIEAAHLLAHESRICFAFVGDGTGKVDLQDMAQGFRNVLFIPFQPRQELPEVLASCDVSLISLKSGIGAFSVPSKCYSAMASRRPIIAAVDRGSDTWNLIENANAGLCVEPNQPAALVEAILSLYRNSVHREEFAASARSYVEKYHSSTSAAVHFSNLLETM